MPTLAKAPDQPTPFASLYERRSHFLSLSTLRTPFSFDGRGLFKLRRRRVTWPRLWTNNLTTFPSAIDEKQSTDKQMYKHKKKEPHKATPSYFFGAAPRVKITSGVPPEPPIGIYGGGRLRSPSGVHVATAPNGGVSLWGSAPIPQVIRQIAECYSPLGGNLLRGGSCFSTIP